MEHWTYSTMRHPSGKTRHCTLKGSSSISKQGVTVLRSRFGSDKTPPCIAWFNHVLSLRSTATPSANTDLSADNYLCARDHLRVRSHTHTHTHTHTHRTLLCNTCPSERTFNAPPLCRLPFPARVQEHM
eukprot:1157610-Pelagomonas_calceolata.AAC.4